MQERPFKFSNLLIWPVIAVFLAPYYLTILPKFFIYDTLVILYYQGRLPLWDIGAFFSRDVYFYWRPIPVYVLAIEYHLFGLNPGPYHFIDIGVHGLNAWLLFVFLKRVSKERWLAWLGTIFFLSNWQYCDTVFWIANLPTLMVTSCILLMMLAFHEFLQSGQWKWFACLAATCGAGMLMKETIVSAPFFLAMLWLHKGGAGKLWRLLSKEKSQINQAANGNLIKGGWLIAFVFMALSIYTLAHMKWIRFSHPLHYPYEYDSPVKWAVNLWMALNHLFLPFADHLLLRESAVNKPLLMLRFLIPVAPLAGIAWMIWRRDKWMALGLGLTIAGLIPVFITPHYNSSRYYYSPSIGMGIVWARFAWAAWNGATRVESAGIRSLLKAGWASVVLLFLLSNYSQLWLTCEMVTVESQYGRKLYEFLRSNKEKFPPDALIVIDDPEIDTFWGWRELSKFALNDDGAELVFEHQSFTEAYFQLLKERPRGRVNLKSLGNFQFEFEGASTSPDGP